MAKVEDPPAPYMAPAPGYSAGYVVQPRPTNLLAIIGLIASCAGAFIPGAVIAGVIMGHISLSQIKRTGEGGRGLALAAVIVGYSLLGVELIAIVLYIVFAVLLVGLAVGSSHFSTSNFG